MISALCLIFRIGNPKDDNFMLVTQVGYETTLDSFFNQYLVTAKIIRRRVITGRKIYYDIMMIKVPCIFLVWSLKIVPFLDQDSPFYELPAFEFVNHKFELLVIMRGACKTSSMKLQTM